MTILRQSGLYSGSTRARRASTRALGIRMCELASLLAAMAKRAAIGLSQLGGLTPWVIDRWQRVPICHLSAAAIMAARRATASPARLAQVLSMRPAARAEVASEPLLDQETRVVRAQMEYTGV